MAKPSICCPATPASSLQAVERGVVDVKWQKQQEATLKFSVILTLLSFPFYNQHYNSNVGVSGGRGVQTDSTDRQGQPLLDILRHQH
jgi:hypothetical protein